MGEHEQGVSIGEVVEGVKPSPSVADLLRQGYQKAQAEREPKAIQLFGYGEPESELWVTFRALDDYEEVRSALRRKMGQSRGLKAAQVELQVAMETLALAAVGSYAIIGGEKHDIGLPLGLELYGHLFPEPDGPAPVNDAQAISLLFHSRTLPIMTAYTEWDQWQKRGGQAAEDSVLGE